MEKLKNETIDLILSDRFNENFWIFELGRSEVIAENETEIEHQFMSSFFERGQVLWEKFKGNFVEYFCNKDTKQPKEFVKEMVEGDLREFITALIGVLTTTYSVPIGLAIPLCGLALKKGINNICS